jgi:hypothetical protein
MLAQAVDKGRGISLSPFPFVHLACCLTLVEKWTSPDSPAIAPE